MKNVRNFESFRNNRKDGVNESAMIVGDYFRVNAIVDIKLSDINSYVKRVKDSLGKNARDVYSDSQIAEEIVKYLTNNIDFNNLSTGFLFGIESTETNDEVISDEIVDTAETDDNETTESDVEEVKPEEEFKDVETNLSNDDLESDDNIGDETTDDNEDLPI